MHEHYIRATFSVCNLIYFTSILRPTALIITMSSSERSDISSGDHSSLDPNYDPNASGSNTDEEVLPIIQTRRANAPVIAGLPDSHDEGVEEPHSNVNSTPGEESPNEEAEIVEGMRWRYPNRTASAAYLQAGRDDPADEADDEEWLDVSDDALEDYDVNSGEELDYDSDESKQICLIYKNITFIL